MIQLSIVAINFLADIGRVTTTFLITQQQFHVFCIRTYDHLADDNDGTALNYCSMECETKKEAAMRVVSKNVNLL